MKIGSRTMVNRLMLGLAVVGLALNVLLWLRAMAVVGIAGCGGQGGCNDVLTSRWSQVMNIPVSLFGSGVYAVLLVALTARGGRRLLIPCLGIIGGAALWFTVVQAFILGRFCPWCMTAHVVGLLLLGLGWRSCGMSGDATRVTVTGLGSYAVAAVAVLSGLQSFGPRPAGHRLDRLDAGGQASAAAVHRRGSGRKVEFDGGRKVYAVEGLPHLGKPDAKHVVVEYFDYSCTACRSMGDYVDALLAQHAGELCVVVLPVPLDRSCNHGLQAKQPDHPGACQLARDALAVWRSRPAAFAGLHRALLGGASLADAERAVRQLVPPAELATALQDPWIDDLIAANVADWQAFSARTPNLPKLLINDKRILHGLPPDQHEFMRVMDRELGL